MDRAVIADRLTQAARTKKRSARVYRYDRGPWRLSWQKYSKQLGRRWGSTEEVILGDDLAAAVRMLNSTLNLNLSLDEITR